jgi:conjugal transfer ATP-binding protein TraC
MEEAPVTDYVDPRVRVGFDETDSGLQHAYSTGNHLFRVGASVVAFARELDTARACANRAVDAFGQIHGVKAIVETAGLWQQFVALAPYSGRTNERLYRVFEENAADFFPTCGPWRGQGKPTCLYWSQWDSLVALDPFDARASSWNAIVAGASGSGKTFFVQSLLTQLLNHDVEVIIVDRGGGYTHLTRALDGQLITIDGSGATSLNPFDLSPGTTVPSPEKKMFLHAILRAMLTSDTSPDPAENALLNVAIEQTYARATTSRRDNVGNIVETFDGVRLSDFITTLITMEDLGDRAMNASERELARQLSGRLHPWAEDSALGQLLDRPTNVRLNAPIVYFETTGLDRHPALREVVLLLLGDFIWRRVQEHPLQRKVVIFDEAWALLKNPQGAAFIGELYRRFRRYGAAVYTIAQSLDDFLTSGATGILENTTYHFLLQLPKQLDQAVKLFGLGDRAREVLAQLSVRKGDFGELLAWVRYDDRPLGEVLVIRPTPIEYWLFTSYDRDVRARAAAMAEAAGEVMPAIMRLAATWPKGMAHANEEAIVHA